VLAIDQDALGLQAVKVRGDGRGLEVWSKRLARAGERAVLFLNRADATASVVVSPIAVSWKELGLAGASATVRDPWTGKDLGAFEDHYTATVQRGDAVLLIVRGTEAKATRVLPAEAAKAGGGLNPVTANEVTFKFKPSTCGQSFTSIQIIYKNPDQAPRMAELRVNGQDATRILFPPTGTADGSIWIQSALNSAEAQEFGNNLMNLSTPTGSAPQIESILVYGNGMCEGGGQKTP
jgi:hypothetical protein